MKELFKVSYSIKETTTNLLVDKYNRFNSFQDAVRFVKTLKNNYTLIGSPVIEREI
jgi:hypothetical protein